MFDELAAELGCEVVAHKAVLYSHQSEGHVTFEKEPYASLFNFAENQDKFVDKVEFILREKRRLVLHAFLSRDATCYFYEGRAAYLFNKVIPGLASVGNEKGSLFSGRGRAPGEMVLKPLEIAYAKDVFLGPGDNLRLIRALSNLDRGAITVHHRNPYLHVSFLDFVDGSSFEIYTGEADRLTIVPNFNCTVHSFMRVYERLNEDLHEGELKELEERSYTLEDFLKA